MKLEYITTLNNLILDNAKTNKASPLYNATVQDAVYKLVHNGIKWNLLNKRKITFPLPQNQKNIIVILESPHKDEFDSYGYGLMPLEKDKSFTKKFVRLFSNSKELKVGLNRLTEYSVYLINAIQFQCSLGLQTAYYRDYIFLHYWEDKYMDFESRLKSLLNNNTIAIVNLCTKGSHKKCRQIFNNATQQYDIMFSKCDNRFMNLLGLKFHRTCNVNSLQELVGDSVKYVISSQLYSIHYTTGTHPSCWWRGGKIY